MRRPNFNIIGYFLRKNWPTPADYVFSLLGTYDVDFYEWAFGKDWDMKAPVTKVLLLWNKRHPEHLIESNALLYPSIDRMIDLWQKEVHGKDNMVPPA